MSDEATPVQLPAQELETPSGRVSSGKEFAEMAYELTDDEIVQVGAIYNDILQKYSRKTASTKNLEALEDEVKSRMHAIGVLATFDPTPLLSGEMPTIDILGKVKGDSFHEYGFDHEKKQYEVQKATRRGEDYLGQKEAVNKRRDK